MGKAAEGFAPVKAGLYGGGNWRYRVQMVLPKAVECLSAFPVPGPGTWTWTSL